MRRLIAGVILLVVATATWAYDPPTDDELAGWWEGLTREERLAQLRALDEIEHATPVLDEPRLVVVQSRDGVINAYFTDALGISIASRLQYEVELPSVTVEGNRERNPWVWLGVGAASAFAVSIGIAFIAN